MSRQAPLFGVATWPPAVRHALLLVLATAVTTITTEVIPQLDGPWLVLVQTICLVAGAILTPLVQGYGLGAPLTPAEEEWELELLDRGPGEDRTL